MEMRNGWRCHGNQSRGQKRHCQQRTRAVLAVCCLWIFPSSCPTSAHLLDLYLHKPDLSSAECFALLLHTTDLFHRNRHKEERFVESDTQRGWGYWHSFLQINCMTSSRHSSAWSTYNPVIHSRTHSEICGRLVLMAAKPWFSIPENTILLFVFVNHTVCSNYLAHNHFSTFGLPTRHSVQVSWMKN